MNLIKCLTEKQRKGKNAMYNELKISNIDIYNLPQFDKVRYILKTREIY